jgi:8-amino-7-oxononanoate synthase
LSTIPTEWSQGVEDQLAALKNSHLLRSRRLITPIDATHVTFGARTLINFASNNYLGLTHHPTVIAAAEKSLRASGAGAGASALISGYVPAHAAAEAHLARWKGTEAAILLPSGYQASHAAVQTLATASEKSGNDVRFLLDKLCHASLIDAVHATGMPLRVFPHNHLPKLARLLEQAQPGQLQVVVTESVFSMDGDAADLPGMARLKADRPFLLLLDEAHATGVFGPAGSGMANELGLRAAVDVTVMTLSKAIGCVGGAVCGSETICRALVNFARAYIYSTSIPPAIAAAADAALTVMEREPAGQQRLRNVAREVRNKLAATGWQIPDGESPIIPLVMGSESAAVESANHLMSKDLLVLAIRPPTVPRGTSRLRITLSSGHTDQELDTLLEAVADLKQSSVRAI